jgi:DNA-binding HxlR family transcriptional regulator
MHMASSGTQATAAGVTASSQAEQACSMGLVLDVVFSRWTTPILWTLNEFGRQRFVELERQIGTITPKVLAQRLKQLERDGLVERTYYPEIPPRVEYEISDLGRSLGPLFATLARWTADNTSKVQQARQAYDAAAERRPSRT